jgi:hypothetical protein
MMLASQARHMARAHPHGKDPNIPVRRVKAYRVVHAILTAEELESGVHPRDPATYTPFYMGEYDAAGNLTNPHDPFLYWMIPIYKKPKNPHQRPPLELDDYEVVDLVRVHAGDPPEPSPGERP